MLSSLKTLINSCLQSLLWTLYLFISCFQVTDFPTSVLLAAVNRAIAPTHVSAAEVIKSVSKQGNYCRYHLSSSS